MVEVEDRTAATLLPFIAKYVEPETTVMSDDWASYRRVHSLGMQQFTVVYKINYVNPLTGSLTLTIESLWSRVKAIMRKVGVCNISRDLFPTYLPEYKWRKKFSKDKVLDHILDHIIEYIHYKCLY
uniref:Putative LOC101856368 [Aplysia californica] n=1 Tax=Lepeophtheirus salmonis TaxID=72036 RepID=A0A0K2UK97_LEPSM